MAAFRRWEPVRWVSPGAAGPDSSTVGAGPVGGCGQGLGLGHPSCSEWAVV